MDPVSGTEGDAEWSENDALDDTDELINPDIASEVEEMADEPESPRFMPKLDAADLIMDAIDRELYEVMRIDGQEKRPKSPSRPKSSSKPKMSPSRTWSLEDSGTISLRSSSPGRWKRPGKTEREALMAAGVEFDTGDETTASTAREDKHVVRTGGSVDTGLGTGSSQTLGSVDQVVSSDEVENEIQKQRRIKGRVSTYSDGEDEEENQYQDREDKILYETTEASRGKETRSRLIKDEDDSSHESLHPSHDPQPEYQKSGHDTENSEHAEEENVSKPARVKKIREMSDTDSVRTEDFEKKFRELSGGNPWTTPSSKHNSADSDSTVTDGEMRKSTGSSDNEKRRKREQQGIWDSLPPHLRPYMKNSRDTDTSSVATEDFESKFKDSLVVSDADNSVAKKKASPQKRPARADSGASSIRTEDFEEKFKDMVVPSDSKPAGTGKKQLSLSDNSEKINPEQKPRGKSPQAGAMPRKYLYLTMKDLTSTDTESNFSEQVKGKGTNKKGASDSTVFDYDKWKKDLEGDIEFARNEDSLSKDVHDSGHDDLDTSDDVESIHTSDHESWSPEGTIVQKPPTRHSSPMPQPSREDRSPSPGKQRSGSPSRRPASPNGKRPRSPEKEQPNTPAKVHPSSDRIVIEDAWEVQEGNSPEKQVPNGFLSQDVDVRRGFRHYSSPDTSSSLDDSGEITEGNDVPVNIMPKERIDILSKYLDKQLDSINKGETGDSTAVEEEEEEEDEEREEETKGREERGVSQPSLYREGSYTSLDTCRTEEYNDRFRRLMVKQVAGVPITSFDTVTVASDLDSVRTDTVRDRFQEVIGGKGAGSRATTDFELSEAESERPEKRHAANRREALEDGLSDFESVKAFPSRTPRYGVVVDSEADDIGNEQETEVVSDVEDSPKHASPEFNTNSYYRSSKAGAMGSSEVGRRRDSGKLQSTPKTYSALPDVSASMPDVSAISVSSDRNRSPGIGGRYRSYDDINSTIMPRAERTNQSPSSLRDAEQGLRDAQAQKQTALSEMREIQESLKSKRSEVNQAEHHVQDMQSKSDELRAEIMVLEYKRDSVEKELQGVHKDMEAMTRPSSRQRDREELGMSKEQVLEVVRERDELRARLRSGEGQISGLERRELERQLNATKEDLFSEQRKSRAKVEELQDELEECKRQLEESQLDKGDAVHQMEQLHLKVKELERARKRDIENKSDALDNASKRARADLTDFKAQLAERDRMIASLEAELHEKDKLNRKLQETVYKMQEELSQESELKDSLIEENEKNVVKLKKDKETSLAALRHMLLEDKQRELDRLRDQSDRERRDILARQEERMAEQLAEMEQRILAKDDEVTMVRERLRQQEEATRTLGDRMRLEAKEQIRSAISKEKASWEAEKERAVQREKDRCQDDSNKQLSKVQEELEKEKQLHNQADKNCTGLKQELDQARQQIRAAHRDKLAAINDVRDSMKVEKEEEIKQLREQLTQEKVSDVEKLREKMRKLEDELRTVRSEKNSVAVREKETSMLLDRHEKSVVSEINDECQRSAQLLGTAPRSVKVPSGDQQEDDEFDQSLDISENRGQSPHKSRSAVSEALANLKATNEDLRKLVTGLHEDMASQKKATQQVNKEKEREVKQLRELYHSEKEKEVETMRERLIQDHLDEIGKLQHAVKKDKDEVSTLQHNLISKDEELREIQRNMTAWKDATIKKLAKKFEQEMNLELEKRQHEKDRQAHSSQLKRIEELEEEVQRLSVVRKTFQSTPTTPSRVSGPSSSSQSSMAGGDASTIKLLRHLQDRVKQLRVENKELRRLSGEGSDAINGNGTPDVSVSFQEEAVLRESPYVQNLERKLKHMDRQLNVAEERAQKNTALLGQKMVELTKLQNQLTHQTKEYLHLERSYSDMQKRYHRGGLR
ncbi:centrosome-associated protein CEP250-like isoform X2 [Branchiostoma lanceolatum]|uniref:centrosome-associated protein CEP250-like isoform X2 n=1 Tax=Branchiostoma lanceolatum TaxID=7740 RepID=UPI0034521051